MSNHESPAPLDRTTPDLTTPDLTTPDLTTPDVITPDLADLFAPGFPSASSDEPFDVDVSADGPPPSLQGRVVSSVRLAALRHALDEADRAVRTAEHAFRAAVDAHAADGVKVMGWVHDALFVRDDPEHAAHVLRAWHEAGGALTREAGAAELADLCAAARAFLAASTRAELLREANRGSFSDEPEAPIVA